MHSNPTPSITTMAKQFRSHLPKGNIIQRSKNVSMRNSSGPDYTSSTSFIDADGNGKIGKGEILITEISYVDGGSEIGFSPWGGDNSVAFRQASDEGPVQASFAHHGAQCNQGLCRFDVTEQNPEIDFDKAAAFIMSSSDDHHHEATTKLSH